MVETPVISGYLIFSHILPAVLGFFSIIIIANGIMDNKREYAIGGVILFFAAAILPFLILPVVLGI